MSLVQYSSLCTQVLWLLQALIGVSIELEVAAEDAEIIWKEWEAKSLCETWTKQKW